MGKATQPQSHRPGLANQNSGADQKKVVWRFIVTFVISLASGGALFAYIASSHHGFMQALMEGTAAITGFTVGLFSDSTTYAGQICTFQNFTVKIIDECTGVLEMVIYTAAVVAYPTGWRHKMWGIVYGVPAIYAFNVIRIILLLVVGAYSKPLFEFMHLYFWQATLIVIIATIWIGWLLLVVYREKDAVAVSS
jgi:exosortase H (IPTLxxWG-CTERM-specific)